MSAPPVRRIDEGRQQFDQATEKLLFTKDFNTSLEAIMGDKLATYSERITAWIKRRSWGNFSLYCIDEQSRTSLCQADCARELGIDRRRVSETFKYLEKRAYLELRRKLIYALIDPSEGPPALNSHSEDVSKSGESGQFRTFLEEWKTAHSSDFCALEAARSSVKNIQKVLLSDYKKWRAARKNRGPSLIESIESIESKVSPSVGNNHEDGLTDQSRLQEIADAVPEVLLEQTGEQLSDTLLRKVSEELKDTPLPLFTQKSLDKRSKFTSLGFLVNVAQDASRSWHRTSHARAAAVASQSTAMQRQNAEALRCARAILDDPASSEIDKAQAREAIGWTGDET